MRAGARAPTSFFVHLMHATSASNVNTRPTVTRPAMRASGGVSVVAVEPSPWRRLERPGASPVRHWRVVEG